jgi:release factor glutamine methyltransferase
MPAISKLLAAATLPGDSGRLEAELLLCHCLQQTRTYLYTWPEKMIDGELCAAYEALLAARRNGVPVAYLTGLREFWSLQLQVDARALIPRPETETLVEWALELPLSQDARVADLGTGSGAIALALASERLRWQLLATDISEGALAVAGLNACRLGLGNIEFLCSDWERSLAPGSFQLIVSNPPYIALADPHLGQGDLRFEPAEALRSGVDGLEAIRRIISMAPTYLCRGGWLLLEHGYDQAEPVRQLLQSTGFSAVTTRPDLAGVDRSSGGMWGD